MQTDRTTETAPDRPDFPGVCIASGYTVKVGTQFSHLRVEDEDSHGRRVRSFARATVPFSRLVVRSVGGYISTEAVRWCLNVGVAVYMIDTDGGLLAVSGDVGADRPELRRAQARAVDNPVALRITRWLVGEKMKGQATVARRLPSPIRLDVPDLDRIPAERPEDYRPIEAQIASVYWRAWRDVPVRFAKSDIARIPRHWQLFGPRTSPISGSTRRAGAPGSALLNLLYSVGAAEGRLVCLGVGLDPGLGVYHVDKASRDSLVYDLIEPVRPLIDEYLLDLLEGHVFVRTTSTRHLGESAESLLPSRRISPQPAHSGPPRSPGLPSR